MRLIQSEFFRAVCMIATGVLVVRYRQQTLTGITVIIGVMFFVSGLFSCASFLSNRRKMRQMPAETDTPSARQLPSVPSCVVGLGCMLFGIVLALMPATFLSFIEQILALLLIMGAISLMATLVAVNREAKIHWAYWILPTLILITGIIVIAKPLELLSAPLFVTGWCMVLYGVVDMLYMLKVYLYRRKVNKAKASEEVEYEEISSADTTE